MINEALQADILVQKEGGLLGSCNRNKNRSTKKGEKATVWTKQSLPS